MTKQTYISSLKPTEDFENRHFVIPKGSSGGLIVLPYNEGYLKLKPINLKIISKTSSFKTNYKLPWGKNREIPLKPDNYRLDFWIDYIQNLPPYSYKRSGEKRINIKIQTNCIYKIYYHTPQMAYDEGIIFIKTNTKSITN